jgi:cysteine desulfurase
MKLPIYMDNHATTPVDPRALAAMLPWFAEKFGNAASRSHAFGWEAEEAVEAARGRVAACIGAAAKDLVFTSGATESDNLALKGVLAALAAEGSSRRHLVTVATEHHAVLDTARALERSGFALTVLPVGPDGLVDPDVLRAALREDTALVSVMAVNNEIGVLQPIAEIGRLCRERGVLFHTDAAQALGKIPLDVEAMSIDLASLSAHKLYGPKGVGALYVRRARPRVRLAPQLAGGGHERGLRSGTLNVPGIVGFGEACAIAAAEMTAEASRLAGLRDRLLARLRAELDGVDVNGSLAARVAGNLNVSFAWVEAESLLLALKSVALSSGAACTSATLEPSHVLRALGAGEERAHGSIRFGLGRFNTAEEVDFVAGEVVREVKRLRGLSPRYEAAKRGEAPVEWTVR